MDRRAPALTLIVLACGLAARAGDDQDKTAPPLRHEIVVTATKVETPAREVASSLTVISAEELRRTRRTTVLEALGDVVGLSVVQNGGPGATASVFIRGANNEHTLVLLDGVVLNDPINPSRSYDLAHLAVSQVARVEIVRGPQSPLFGSDAMGGVINIITQKGQGPAKFNMSMSAGNYGTLAGDVGFSGSSGRTDYSLALSAMGDSGVSAADVRYPGNSEKDGYRNLTFSGRVGFSLRPNLDLDVTLRAVSARTSIDSFGGPYGDDPNDVQRYRSLLGRILLRGLFASQRWEQKLSVSWVGSDRRLANPPDPAHPDMSESATYDGGLVQIDWQNNIFLSPWQTLTAGFVFCGEQGHSDYTSVSPYGTYVSAFPEERAEDAGFYAQDQWNIWDTLFLAAGARLDIHSRTGTALTYRVAPAFVVERTGTKLRATLGTGFKSPSLYQLFAPPTIYGPVGNPDLRPERVVGWDAGFDQDVVRNLVRFGLTYFSETFQDLIDFDYVVGYINVSRARTSGLELSIDARPLGPDRPLDLRAAYTRLSARNRDTGEALLRRPRDKFSAELGTRALKRFDLAASVLVMGPRPDRDFSAPPYPTVSLPAYVLVNAVVSTPVGRSLEVFVRADNILDSHYETVWGYGTYGFSLMAGVRLGR